jgi:hypothetical protein
MLDRIFSGIQNRGAAELSSRTCVSSVLLDNFLSLPRPPRGGRIFLTLGADAATSWTAPSPSDKTISPGHGDLFFPRANLRAYMRLAGIMAVSQLRDGKMPFVFC